MLMIDTKDRYHVAHITNEIGKYIVGGIANVVNELYAGRDDETCFIHLFDAQTTTSIQTAYYPGNKDIYAIPMSHKEELSAIDFDIAVFHFYGLYEAITEEMIAGRKIIYVIHSVCTPEPYDVNDPFGGNPDIENIFRWMCEISTVLVCVSEAEREKLIRIIPQTRNKTVVIHNGMTFDHFEFKREIREQRNLFGYLGRIDYRKGILETLRVLKRHRDIEYFLACGKGDATHLKDIKNYIEAAELENNVHFLGFCTGKRREQFFETIDCLIISSLYEPFGYILLEALMADVPIICSNNGGLAEMLRDYRFQYNPYEEGALEAVLQVFREATTHEILEECRKLKNGLQLFTSERMVEKYKKLFAAL